MTADPTHDLLAELAWLRALARRLVRDPERADDLVQDACGLALRQPAPPRSWRAWLASVLPNLAHGQRRRDAARVRRETDQARGDADAAAADTAELVLRAEAQQRLAAAVLRLDEPYRSVVLLRFFDGLPPRRIAARLAVPVATVHSRLQRALQQLRARLDVDFTGRQNWLAAFAPFAWPAPLVPLLPAAAGALVMQTKAKLLVAATAVLACSTPLWWPDRAEPTEPFVPAIAGERSPRGSDGAGGGAARATGGDAPERRTAAALPAAATAPTAAARTVHGRVLDSRAQPLGGVPIGRLRGDTIEAHSEPNGAFTFATAGDTIELGAIGDRFVTVLEGSWSATASIPPVVVVAEALALGGRVVDEAGRPIAGSEVVLQLPDDFDARFAVPLDRAGRGRWSARSGADGSFALRAVPRLDGASLVASADTFAPVTVPQPTTDDANVQLVLRRFHFTGGELRGRVVDPAGAPAPGARVTMGVTSVVSDEQGTFALSLQRAGWPTALVAAKAGHRPARLEIPRQGGTRREDWPAEIVLRLGPAPATVRGRVVDQGGRPIAKAEVWLADPTPLGVAAVLPLQLEYLIAGGEVPPQAARMRVPFADEPTRDGSFMDQTSDVMQPTACWFFVTADEQGTFAVPGLLDRPYTLRAFDPATGLFGDAADVVGDTHRDVVVVRDVWPELRGRVVSRRGEPLANVRIDHTVIAYRADARVPGGRFEGTALRRGASTVTGADGTFALRDVGRQRSIFALSGDTIVPTSVRAERITDPRACDWTVEARCHVEVVLQDASEADDVTCFDGDGAAIDVAVLRRNSNQFVTELPLHAGKSGLFVVGEGAAKVVLRRAGRPVRTIPFTPDPKRTTTLQ